MITVHDLDRGFIINTSCVGTITLVPFAQYDYPLSKRFYMKCHEFCDSSLYNRQMSIDNNHELLNYAQKCLETTISCQTPSMDGYDVSRILEDQTSAMPSSDVAAILNPPSVPGFVAEPFIKTPVDIDISFK